MREWMTTALDVLGLILVAIGLAFFLWPTLGGAALAISGGLILAGSAFADRPIRTARRKNAEPGEVRR